MTQIERETLENAIKLISKGMAENAFENIVLPRLPLITIKSLENILRKDFLNKKGKNKNDTIKRK